MSLRKSILAIGQWLFLPLLGALAAVFAGAIYYGLEWAWRDYDDHARGMWEGSVLVYSITLGHVIAKRVVRWRLGRRR